MQDVNKDLETQELIDMLAQHTKEYTKLMSAGLKEEFEQCKQTIAQLQQEITSRQRSSQVQNTD